MTDVSFAKDPASPVDISVIICTRNRAAQLAIGLEAMVDLHIPPELRWELIVVDNGSSDETTAAAQSFAGRLPIRVVQEEEAGLSHARNCGVAEARGTYICWTDDDLVLDRNWLAAYAAAFQRHPEAAIFGGKIIPVLEGSGPAWFQRYADRWPLTTLLAKRDLGDVALPLNFNRGAVPWGANFAVRAAEQKQTPYEPGLGVSPRQRRLGEESEVIFRILRTGASGWWVPDSKVHHIIPLKRQTWDYVLEYFRAYGETLAYLERAWPGDHHMSADRRAMARVTGGAAELKARAGANWLVYLAARLVGATERSLIQLMKVGMYLGAADVAAERAPEAKRGL